MFNFATKKNIDNLLDRFIDTLPNLTILQIDDINLLYSYNVTLYRTAYISAEIIKNETSYKLSNEGILRIIV